MKAPKKYLAAMGVKGGKARAVLLSAKRRSEIARMGGLAKAAKSRGGAA